MVDESSSPRGLAVFDPQPAKPTGPSKENLKSKVTKQPTLFAMKKTTTTKEVQEESTPPPTKSGFSLWLEQNKTQLKEEHPDANDAELVRLGAQKFKTLPEEERQVLS